MCVLPSATSSSTAPLTWDRHQRLWPSPSPGTEDKFRLYVQHEDHIKKPLSVSNTTNVSCEELVILICKSSWNTKISSKFTWIRERAVDQDCVQQSVPNIWPQQHQTSDDLHMHQNTEVGPYFGFSMICNSGQIQITINIQTFNNTADHKTGLNISFTSEQRNEQEKKHTTWPHESY